MVSENPFVDPHDPLPSSDQRPRESPFAMEATLTVGKTATLTLGTDALLALDEEREGGGFASAIQCCGLSSKFNTLSIPFYNILWAELVGSELSIQYASPVSKNVVKSTELKYDLEGLGLDVVQPWISQLLDKSYGEAQQQKRALVLVNPHAGKGNAVKWYYNDAEPILQAARCKIDVIITKHGGEAVDIANNMDIDAFDIVVTCSGDGLAYEVFNGLGKRADARKALSKIAVTHIPCGSGNAMSHNLYGTNSPSIAALGIIKGIPTPLDLISITQGDTRTLSFLSQSVGIIAECDLGTENLRWMGSARFTYGFLVRLFGKICYPCDLAVKVAIEDKASIKEHYRKELESTVPTSERRGNKYPFDDDSSATSTSGASSNDEGLPPLKYGTINDKLPDGWELVPYDKLGNFYCGNMAYMTADTNFFPTTLPNDGLMDLICINGDISRLSAVSMIASVENSTLIDLDVVSYRKILAYRIIPKNQKDGYISIDGERIPFAQFQAEIHRGLGTVLTKSGNRYEQRGPP
ncbi:hypothetical protein B7463_g3243, partial [Scytalidium lignicola]